MTRWGAGPRWGGVTLVYALSVLVAARSWPDLGDLPVSWRGFRLTAGSLLSALGGACLAVSLWKAARARQSGVLAIDGCFSVVRHPAYAAWILLLLPGLALFHESALMLAMPMVAYAAFRAFIDEEDRELESSFGDAYRAYRSRTPALFPRLTSSRGSGPKRKPSP